MTNFLESTSSSLPVKSLRDIATTIDHNIESIKCEELNFRSAEAPLGARRNSSIPPINMLPSEVLAQIFKIVACFTPPSDRFPPLKAHDYERILSQVCSRWRQIALGVCPLWYKVALIFESRDRDEDNPIRAEVGLYHKLRWYIKVLVPRQPGVADGPYIQTILDTINPYKRNISKISMYAQSFERLHALLDLLLDNEPPESLVELAISEYSYSETPPTTSFYSHRRLSQLFRPVKKLRIHSVGLDWSSVASERLTDMALESLPPSCCPNLEQLIEMLLACPSLRDLRLEGIAFPALPHFVPSGLVKLEHLEFLSLNKLESSDLQKVLSILSTGHYSLHLCLSCDISNIKTLGRLRSFASRANVGKVSFSGPLCGGTLSQAVLSFLEAIPNVKDLVFYSMNLYEGDLSTRNDPPVNSNNRSQAPALTNTDSFARQVSLTLSSCTIHASSILFHNAISALPLSMLTLKGCEQQLIIEDSDGDVYEARIPITPRAELGTRLSELMPGRTTFDEGW
ncbi:hypothetical protein BDV93DRAFT_608036 [Ceratobasidium sp. AG-I]|nr:hypothetical protein BDV93DRAFT_608036 [Ceratobasidium sp. AG-I]